MVDSGASASCAPMSSSSWAPQSRLSPSSAMAACQIFRHSGTRLRSQDQFRRHTRSAHSRAVSFERAPRKYQTGRQSIESVSGLDEIRRRVRAGAPFMFGANVVLVLRRAAFSAQRSVFATAVRIALLAHVLGTPATAQVIHLPPAHRRVLPPNTPVLTIVPNGNLGDATISVDADQVFIQRVDGVNFTVALGDRLIRDVMNQLVAELQQANVTVRSRFPMYPASYIGSKAAEVVPAGDEFVVLANADEPDIRIGFGLVMGLAAADPDKTAAGILTQEGFQLDVVGSHQMVGPSRTDAGKWRALAPVVYTQWRLGVNTDQQVQLESSAKPSAGSVTSQQFEQALAQADQVAVSGQADIQWTNATKRFGVVLTPSYAIQWTRLQPPPLPRVLVGDGFKDAGDVFSAAAVKRTRTDLLRVQPLSELGLMGVLQFLRRDSPAFYVGAGVMSREILVPRVSFERAPPATPSMQPGDPIPESVRGSLAREAIPVWRATMGAKLAGVLDLRLDASGSIGRQRTDPLLRILLARAFPVGG